MQKKISTIFLQEKYSLLDAVVVGGLGITLLNNADSIEIACLAQLINVIAPITTAPNGGVLKQATYHPFHMLSKYGRGLAMKAVTDAPKYDSVYGQVNVVEPAVIYDEASNEVRVFVLNADTQEDICAELDLQGYGDLKLKKHLSLCGEDPSAINTFEEPDKITMKELDVTDEKAAVLPKMSWNVLIFG